MGLREVFELSPWIFGLAGGVCLEAQRFPRIGDFLALSRYQSLDAVHIQM